MRTNPRNHQGALLAMLGSCLWGLMFSATTCLAAPILPNINTNNVVTITNAPYNGAGDGVTDNTVALSNAVLAASLGGATNGLYGGTVRVPGPGVYLSGPLTLRNNVNIQIDAGATLQMQPLSLWTNLPAQNQPYGNLFYASGLTNLEISGSGTIDGQGANWWSAGGTIFNNRPYMVYFNGNCGRVLIQDVRLQNPPKMHIVFKGFDNEITIRRITINTTAANAANTDGIDLVGTNCLVQDCVINAGDDNIALGSSGPTAVSTQITVTNCSFGKGHGVSIGSNTFGGVSNLTVVNCTFDGTDYGVRMKSNDATNGGSGQGGIAQDLHYYNLGMTNIVNGAVVIYSYYGSGGQFGTPTKVSPYFASTQAVDATSVPVWRNITISNVTATVASNGLPGIIWARMEAPATNIVFDHVSISGTKSFDVYSAKGVRFVDCQIAAPAGSNTFLVYNSDITVSNSSLSGTVITFDGLSTNGYGSSLALYGAPAALGNTNVFEAGPITIGSSTLTVSNHLNLGPSSAVNFILGTNSSQLNSLSNLALSGAVNLTAGPGFSSNSYTLFTYGGTLTWGPPTLAGTPGGINYRFQTNTVGQVQVVPGILTVTNVGDSGPGSLRQELLDARAGDIIVFSNGLTGTIVLTNGQLVLSNSINIVGPGPDRIAIRGNPSRILLVTNGSAVISGVCLTNGRPKGSLDGGGVYVNVGASLVLSNCWLLGNSTAGFGGGVLNEGTLTVLNSILANNFCQSGPGRGGGVYNAGGTAVFRNCTISSNSTADSPSLHFTGGGGVFNSGGASRFLNCTVCSNRVYGGTAVDNCFGGGIYNDTNVPSGTVFLTNCTVAYNAVAGNGFRTGGGIAGNSISVAGCVVAKNIADTGPDVNGGFTSGGYNLIGQGDSGAGLVNGLQHDQVGSTASPLDPLLAGLQLNGGLTPTIVLRGGSPAIDKGYGFGLETDQRGAPRPFDFGTVPNAGGGDGSDIGAFEVASPHLHLQRGVAGAVLFWDSYYAEFNLVRATNLAQSSTWATLPGIPVVTDDYLTVTDAVPSGTALYRLKSKN